MAIIAIAGLAASPVQAGVLWYNGDTNGVDSRTNQNDIVNSYVQVLYNDFNVTGAGWKIDSVWSNDIFTNGPPGSTTAAWEIRSNMPTGTLVASGDSLATLTQTGFTYNAGIAIYTEYQVLVSGLNVNLAPGTYWLAVYPDNLNGGVVGNDVTNGANAVGTPPGNNGNLYYTKDLSTFNQQDLDTSMGVSGTQTIATPAPSTLVMSSILFGMFGFVWSYKRLRQTAAAA